MIAWDLAESARHAAANRARAHTELLEGLANSYSVIDHKGRKVYLLGAGDGFGVQRHRIAFHPTPSPQVPEHALPYVLIIYCLSGALSLVVDGKPAALASGECAVLDRRVPHLLEETEEDDVAAYVMLAEEFFDGFMLDGIAALASPFATALTSVAAPHEDWRLYHTSKNEIVRVCMERILCEHLDPDRTSPYLVNYFLAALFTHLMRTYEAHGPLDEELWERAELVGQVREYISRHYREGNLGQMAIDLGYERTYLSKLIRTYTGSTFKQLVNDERMRHASLMLRGTSRPIYDIAQAVGLANLTSFYTRFREYYGCTPKEYREAR